MKPISWLGILLIVAGALVLAYQGINYTRQKKVIDVGSLHVTTEDRARIPLFLQYLEAWHWLEGSYCWSWGQRTGHSPQWGRGDVAFSTPGTNGINSQIASVGSREERRIQMLLLIIVLLLLFGGGGGYYGYSRWGSRGGLGIVGTVLIIALILYLLGFLR